MSRAAKDFAKSSIRYDVMVAGHLCFDVIPRFIDSGVSRFDQIFRPGKLVLMGEATMSTGGPVSNTGIALKRLGNTVCFCARVGDDEFGRLNVERLKQSGNAEGIRVVPGTASSYTIVVAPPGIDRVFLHNPGTNNEFGAEDLSSDLIAACRHFHFGYPPLMRRMYANEGRELAAVFRLAKQAGATTSCDMALPDPASASGQAPWRKILTAILPDVDLFLPSVEESLYMIDPDRFVAMKHEHRDADLIDYLTPEQYSGIADQLLELGAKMVALKSGHRGYYLKTKSARAFESMGAARPGDPGNWSARELWCPAYAVTELASATGSGDSSIAGFLAAFLRGAAVEVALKFATCLGWQNVQVPDAVSGIRSLAETNELIAKKMPLIDAHIAAPGWTWHEELGVWAGPSDPLSRCP
ncbi:MAG: hypothetical protein A2W31_17800 [Planctomycetes bacterium RBG_16_64_10]|nr:MAG: hypothetical protein A2W31_17800 [Planctomycetes bacterium RBG_16_64_10]